MNSGFTEPQEGERQIGQYILEEKLGEGGMAEVWKARNQVLGTPAAIKFLNQSFAGHPETEQRFLGEGKRQAQLRHPNIVSAFDFIYLNGRSYLVMEYIEGEGLDTRLLKLQGPMPLADVLTISRDVLGALGYAHAHNVVHRDVKPSNILLENGGRVYVMDFGIALVTGEQRLTRIDMCVGTPHYMSPEQIVSARNIDCRSDIYAYGCVLYEMLTNHVPFDVPGYRLSHQGHAPAPGSHAVAPTESRHSRACQSSRTSLPGKETRRSLQYLRRVATGNQPSRGAHHSRRNPLPNGS
jgi:serine/threonine protein kinase